MIKDSIWIFTLVLLLGIVTGCENNLLAKIYENINRVVEFRAIPEKALVNQTIEFTDLTNIKGVLSRDWDFDGDRDFNDAEGKIVYHAFDSSRIYQVRLQITTDSATIESDPKSIYVQEEISGYLIADDISLPYIVHAGYIDDDEYPDVVSVKGFINGITWWKNPNSFALWEEQDFIVDEGVGAVHVADINLDGNDDIIGIAYDSYTIDEASKNTKDLHNSGKYSNEERASILPDTYIVWYSNLGNGEEWEKYYVSGLFFIPWDIKVGYIDNDEYPDIIACSKYDAEEINDMIPYDVPQNDPREDDRICWWRNPGPNSKFSVAAWEKYDISEQLNNPSKIDVADIDGDGDLDVLGSEKAAHRYAWWENKINENGNNDNKEPWIKHCIPNEFETFKNAYVIIAVDIDQNGIMDVVTSTDWSGTIIWWENVNGDGSVWDKNIISTEINSVLYLCAANINGNVDIFCSAYREGMVYWLKNLGESEETGEYEWEGHILVHNFEWPATVFPVDINNDGILDILASAAKGNKICWWNGKDIK